MVSCTIVITSKLLLVLSDTSHVLCIVSCLDLCGEIPPDSHSLLLYVMKDSAVSAVSPV